MAQGAPAVLYWPIASRNTFTPDIDRVPRGMAFAVRTTRSSAPTLTPEIREAVRAVNPNLALASVGTLDEIRDRSVARTSFTLVMLLMAAGVALAMGLVGIYGVLSYVVSQRTREIGVRIALGATPRDVSASVLQDGALLVGLGVAIGLVVASALTRLMSSLLYGVGTMDPVTFASVAALLGTVALVASYLPARRAARVDPAETLRFE